MLFFSSLMLLFSAFFGSFAAQTLEDAVSAPTVSDESTLLIDTPEPGTRRSGYIIASS